MKKKILNSGITTSKGYILADICERIIKEDEKLKLLSSIDEINRNIYKYLVTHYKINGLEIVVRKNDNVETIFESNTNLDHEYFTSVELLKSAKAKINFKIFSDEKEIIETIETNKSHIHIILEIFSQSLYNKLLEDSISQLTLIDSVTGAYNRTFINNYLQKILDLELRENKKVAFLKVGVDKFKAVIDEFDYSTGDKVLKKLVEVIKDRIRSSDVIVKIDSGDFLVILLNISDVDNVIKIAEDLIDNFSKTSVVVNEEKGFTLFKTICIGISIFPDDSLEIDEIIKHADIAIYEARNLGRSKYFVYKDEDVNSIDLF